MMCNSHAHVTTSVMRSAQRAANRPDVPVVGCVHLTVAPWAEYVTTVVEGASGLPGRTGTPAGTSGPVIDTFRGVAAESAAGLECAAAGRVICCEQVALITTSTNSPLTSAPRAGAACTYDWPPRLSSHQGRRPEAPTQRRFRSLAVVASVSCEGHGEMYFTREGEMPTYPRLARIAVQETEDVEDAAMALIRDLRRALSDGAVTTEEAFAILERADYVREQAREAVVAAIRTDVGELVAAAQLTGEPLPDYTRRQAREVGLDPVRVFPTVPEPVELYEEPLEAA
jgi:hypothetical protein